ncbi:hypothetical protein YC2023_021775 [Brassica napus]
MRFRYVTNKAFPKNINYGVYLDRDRLINFRANDPSQTLMGPPLLLTLRTIMVCYLHLTHLIVNEIQMSLRLLLVSIIHMWLIR